MSSLSCRIACMRSLISCLRKGRLCDSETRCRNSNTSMIKSNSKYLLPRKQILATKAKMCRNLTRRGGDFFRRWRRGSRPKMRRELNKWVIPIIWWKQERRSREICYLWTHQSTRHSEVLPQSTPIRLLCRVCSLLSEQSLTLHA